MGWFVALIGLGCFFSLRKAYRLGAQAQARAAQAQQRMEALEDKVQLLREQLASARAQLHAQPAPLSPAESVVEKVLEREQAHPRQHRAEPHPHPHPAAHVHAQGHAQKKHRREAPGDAAARAALAAAEQPVEAIALPVAQPAPLPSVAELLAQKVQKLPPPPPVVSKAAAAPPPPPAPRAELPARGSPAEAAQAVASYSAWRETFRPFLLENIGWFIGGFLVIAGSLYFIREAWGAFERNAIGRHLLATFVLLAYSAGFLGVGLWLKRHKALGTASRAMAYVGLSLLPVALVQAANLFTAGKLAYAVTLPIAVAAAYPIAYLGAGLLDRPLARPLASALCALLALEGLLPAANAFSPGLAMALPYLGWAVVHAASAVPLRAALAPAPAAIAFHLSSLAYGLAFVVGLAHVETAGAAGSPGVAADGPLLALAALTAVRVDVELRARWKGNPEVDAAVVAAFAAALGGIFLAASDGPLFALSAALAAALYASALRWYRRPLLLHFAMLALAAASWALIFRAPPLASLISFWSEAGERRSLWPAAPAVFAFLLLPLPEIAARLAVRYQLRDEERLRRAAELARWWTLAAIACWLLTTRDPRGVAPTLLALSGLLCFWHRKEPRERTAVAGALAFGLGALCLGLGRWQSTGAALGAASLASFALALPGLRGTGARRGSSALLALAFLLALAQPVAAPGLAGAFEPLPLAVIALVSSAAAWAFASALPGLVAALAASALLAVALFGRDLSGLAQPAPGLLFAIVPAAHVALAAALRAASHKLRAREPWTLAGLALPWRARGLHALSVPLLTLGWISTTSLAARALFAGGAVAAALLASSAALYLALGRLARAPAAKWLSALALICAGAKAGPLLFGPALGSLGLGAAAAALAAFALTAVRKPARDRRLGTALLLAFAFAAGAGLVLDLGVDALLRRDLALATGSWALAAVLLSSAEAGAVAALLSAWLLVFTLQPGARAFSTQRIDALWLAAAFAQIAASFALRRLAGKLRGARPRLPTPRARGLHALSEPLRWSAWLVSLAVAAQGLVLADLRGARLLAGVGVAALSLGALGRRKNLPGLIAAACFTAAGGAALYDADARLGAAILGALAAASLVAALAPLGQGMRRFRGVAAAARKTAFALVMLSAFAGLGALVPLAFALAGKSALPSSSGMAELALALALSVPTLLWLRRAQDVKAAPLAVLAAAGACLAGVHAAGRPLPEVGTALAALAVAAVWAEKLLRDRAGPLGELRRALVWGAPLLAALAFCASMLPPSEAFAAPLHPAGGGWHPGHIPADALLVAFLLSSLAARGGPVFLHLLFIELAVLASRVRLSLAIPTRGHGMVLAGGALLGLALVLRKKPRYSFATLLWCALALAGGWARMLFGGPLGPSVPDLQEWAWALAAALLAVPLARSFLPRATSIFAAAGSACALAAGAARHWPDLAGGTALVAPAAIGLAFAALALVFDRLDAERSPWCAPAPLAWSLRGTALVAVALAGMPAACWTAAAALRVTPLAAAQALPVGASLAFTAAAAFLLVRRVKPDLAGRALVVGGALALIALADPALEAAFGPVAPVAALLALAVLAHALALLPNLREELAPAALVLWVVALLSTHARTGEWTTAAALAVGALLLRGVPLLGPTALFPLPTALLLGGVGFGLAFGAARSPLLSDLGVLAGVGAAALVAAWLHELTSAGQLQARSRAGLVALVGAGFLVAAGASEPLGARPAAIALGALLCSALLARRAVGTASSPASPRSLFPAAAALGLLFFYGRAQLGLGDAISGLDRDVALGAAVLFIGLERAIHRRRADLSAPLVELAALLPLALIPDALRGNLARSAAAAALLYGLIGWLYRRRAPAYLALALANAFFFATWRERGGVEAQLYTIPLGASLLLAAQLSRGDLPRKQLQLLRGLGCVVLYAGTAWQMVGSDELRFPALLAAMSLVTVALAVWLRVRAFAWLGTATLVVTVLSNLVRASVHSRLVLAVSATLTGLTIMGGMAYFSVRREQALQLYRRLQRGMEDWD